jgi:predicted HicB family RNase H-like nuclease
VRLRKSLHAALASEAEAEGVSLNQLVVAKLMLHLQAEYRKHPGGYVRAKQS